MRLTVFVLIVLKNDGCTYTDYKICVSNNRSAAMHFAFYNLNLTSQCHAMGKSQYITSAFISGLDTPDDFHCCHIKDIPA